MYRLSNGLMVALLVLILAVPLYQRVSADEWCFGDYCLGAATWTNPYFRMWAGMYVATDTWDMYHPGQEIPANVRIKFEKSSLWEQGEKDWYLKLKQAVDNDGKLYLQDEDTSYWAQQRAMDWVPMWWPCTVGTAAGHCIGGLIQGMGITWEWEGPSSTLDWRVDVYLEHKNPWSGTNYFWTMRDEDTIYDTDTAYPLVAGVQGLSVNGIPLADAVPEHQFIWTFTGATQSGKVIGFQDTVKQWAYYDYAWHYVYPLVTFVEGETNVTYNEQPFWITTPPDAESLVGVDAQDVRDGNVTWSGLYSWDATATAYVQATSTAQVEATQTARAQQTATAQSNATATAQALLTPTPTATPDCAADPDAPGCGGPVPIPPATMTAIAIQTGVARATATAAARATATARAVGTAEASVGATQTAVARASATAEAAGTATAVATVGATATPGAAVDIGQSLREALEPHQTAEEVMQPLVPIAQTKFPLGVIPQISLCFENVFPSSGVYPKICLPAIGMMASQADALCFELKPPGGNEVIRTLSRVGAYVFLCLYFIAIGRRFLGLGGG